MTIVHQDDQEGRNDEEERIIPSTSSTYNDVDSTPILGNLSSIPSPPPFNLSFNENSNSNSSTEKKKKKEHKRRAQKMTHQSTPFSPPISPLNSTSHNHRHIDNHQSTFIIGGGKEENEEEVTLWNKSSLGDQERLQIHSSALHLITSCHEEDVRVTEAVLGLKDLLSTKGRDVGDDDQMIGKGKMLLKRALDGWLESRRSRNSKMRELLLEESELGEVEEDGGRSNRQSDSFSNLLKNDPLDISNLKSS